MFVAGCGSGGSTPPASAGGTADATAQGTFNAQLADQHSGSKAVGAGALLATTTTPASTPVVKTATAPAPAPVQTVKAQTPTHTTAAKPVTHIHVITTPGHTRTVVVTRRLPPKVIVHTVTHAVARTITVTKIEAPVVPQGAFMPSRHQTLAQTRFMVPGGNVGCELSAAGARCDIQQRVWAPPPQPSGCTSEWGNAITIGRHGIAAFACGGRSAVSAGSKVVPDGWDDKVGRMTCEVRSFGLNCFSASGHGFILSRTGYTRY